MNVLVVEDDLMERQALQKLFQLCYHDEFSVLTAFDGASALDRVRRYRFDLVILDIVLPDMSGIDVLEEIQKMAEVPKVIMATACSDYDHLREAMRGHAIDYIIKPYSIKTFQDAIDGFLQQRDKNVEMFGSQKAMQTIRQYIEENYQINVKLDDLATMVSLDKSYIERLFKKQYGISIFSFLMQTRISKAKYYLSQGMNVSETARKVGFEDPAYFGKCFKAIVGKSPGQYKK